MQVTSYSDFRKNMKKYMDEAIDDMEEIIISRSGNRNVVVLSQEEYDNLKENQHVLGSKKNRAWLDESIAQMKSGQASNHELIDEDEDTI